MTQIEGPARWPPQPFDSQALPLGKKKFGSWAPHVPCCFRLQGPGPYFVLEPPHCPMAYPPQTGLHPARREPQDRGGLVGRDEVDVRRYLGRGPF